MIIVLLLIMLLTVSTGSVVYKTAEVPEIGQEIYLTEISVFNDPIAQYEGIQLGSSVKSLMSQLIANAGNNSMDESRLPDITYVDFNNEGPEVLIEGTDYFINRNNNKFTIISDVSNPNIDSMSKLRKEISSSHEYEVEVKYDDKTRLINEVIISY